MRDAVTVPVEKLNLEPYASIVCYPKVSLLELENRIKELEKHGVTAIEFAGKALAFNMPVLGKGYVGIVVTALVKGVKVALKMRRVDSDRQGLEQEAELLFKANQTRVGPKFLDVSKNFLLMQLVDGELLAFWLDTHREKELVRRVLVDILEQCWRLDEVGLDHGELSKAPKHLLVDKTSKPFIVDFETASIKRKVANVTAVCQFLFVGNNSVANIISKIFGERQLTKIVDTLKNYKRSRNRQNFEKIIEVCFS